MTNHRTQNRVLDAADLNKAGAGNSLIAKSAEEAQRRVEHKVLDAAEQNIRSAAKSLARNGAEQAQRAEEAQRRVEHKVLDAAEQNIRSAAKSLARNGAEQAQRAEETQHRVEQKVLDAAEHIVQKNGQNLDLMLRVGSTAASSYQAILSELAQYAQQAVQRNIKSFTQVSQARTPSDLLNVQSRYLTDSLQAVLATNARCAEITADAAYEMLDKLPRRAT